MNIIATAMFVMGLVGSVAGLGFMHASQRNSEDALRILDRAKIHHDATAALLGRIEESRRANREAQKAIGGEGL